MCFDVDNNKQIQVMEPVQNEKGEWVIPASRRPDGTWRKEKVMKEGYVPQEEIRAFATRASANKFAPKGIPGLAPAVEVKKQKSAPQQQPKKDKQPTTGSTINSVTDGVSNLKVSSSSNSTSNSANAVQAAPVIVVPVDPAVETAKKLKALKKKLRDIEEIANKKTEDLTPEQREKLSRRAEIESDIARLSV